MSFFLLNILPKQSPVSLVCVTLWLTQGQYYHYYKVPQLHYLIYISKKPAQCKFHWQLCPNLIFYKYFIYFFLIWKIKDWFFSKRILFRSNYIYSEKYSSLLKRGMIVTKIYFTVQCNLLICSCLFN